MTIRSYEHEIGVVGEYGKQTVSTTAKVHGASLPDRLARHQVATGIPWRLRLPDFATEPKRP
jgi:hypothetical protein